MVTTGRAPRPADEPWSRMPGTVTTFWASGPTFWPKTPKPGHIVPAIATLVHEGAESLLLDWRAACCQVPDRWPRTGVLRAASLWLGRGAVPLPLIHTV